jgi:hypothetical protein
MEAENTMALLLSKIMERVAYHRDSFRAFWGAGMTPDERIAALNAYTITLPNGEQVPASGVYLAFASENIRQLANIAAILKVDLTDLIAPEHFIPPRELIANTDGTVSLGPPADGFDAWGNPIPIPEPQPEPAE